MRSACTLLLSIFACLAMAACSAQPAAESEAPAVTDSSGEGSVTPSPSPKPSEETTPSAAAGPLNPCELLLADSDAPSGTTATEPRSQSLDDLRAEAEGLEQGSPGRIAADANVAAYEAMGLVTRCSRAFSDPATGATVSTSALGFEDDSGPAAYIDFLMEGCEATELPSAATVDATAFVCNSGVPMAFVVVTDGIIAQVVSASAPPGGAFNEAALIEQASALIEAIPGP